MKDLILLTSKARDGFSSQLKCCLFFSSRKIRTRYNAHSVKRLKNECKFIITNPLRREELFHKIPLLVSLAEMSPCFCPRATAPTFSHRLRFPRALSRVPGLG